MYTPIYVSMVTVTYISFLDILIHNVLGILCTLDILTDCGKFFYVPESFVAHLKTKHGLLTAFKCHICTTVCAKIEQLVTVSNFRAIFVEFFLSSV